MAAFMIGSTGWYVCLCKTVPTRPACPIRLHVTTITLCLIGQPDRQWMAQGGYHNRKHTLPHRHTPHRGREAGQESRAEGREEGMGGRGNLSMSLLYGSIVGLASRKKGKGGVIFLWKLPGLIPCNVQNCLPHRKHKYCLVMC